MGIDIDKKYFYTRKLPHWQPPEETFFNHIHVLLSTLKNSPMLYVILQNHKRFTAVKCNKILNCSGQFWAEESFDTIIRNESHFYNVLRYIINNPVKAGLVDKWNDWKWTYIHTNILKDFLLSPE
ncbi:MAG TPA: hypothetical protein VI461_14040 [Chitinophagaceae bacterium]|nr:hypothetical protein [Chitinophagaceae bacterium]